MIYLDETRDNVGVLYDYWRQESSSRRSRFFALLM